MERGRTGPEGAPSGCEADAPARRESWRAVPQGEQGGQEWCRADRVMPRGWSRRVWFFRGWRL